MRLRATLRAGMVAATALATLDACKREERRFTEVPPTATADNGITMPTIQPGPALRLVHAGNPYDENAYAISQGKQLFEWMNCSGCHFHGGGGIGPPLMDDEWIYGSAPENIFATIIQGRPNGMPSFRGKLSDQQVWQLVAYVRSLSGLAPKGARSGRDDHMYGKPAEQQYHPQKPVQSGIPKKSEIP